MVTLNDKYRLKDILYYIILYYIILYYIILYYIILYYIILYCIILDYIIRATEQKTTYTSVKRRMHSRALLPELTRFQTPTNKASLYQLAVYEE